MSLAEVAGYLASLLVFTTFYMRTMVPLRVVAVCSNIAFISYGFLEGLIPILVLHCALLPLNLFRLGQLVRLLAEMREATSGELPLEALIPFMATVHVRKGEVLFREGDPGREMFLIRHGVIRLPELGRRLQRGDPLGEISLFSTRGVRTTSAVAETDLTLLRLSDRDVWRICYQQPRFSLYLLRFITHRLSDNADANLTGPAGAQQENRAEAPVARPFAPSRAPRPAALAPSGGRRPAATRFEPAATTLLVAASLGGLLWILGPSTGLLSYRDATVTTWLNVATAPVGGRLVGPLPAPGERIGADGTLARVRVDATDPTAALQRAEARVAVLREHHAQLAAVVETMRSGSDGYAAAFVDELDLQIARAKHEQRVVSERLALERARVQPASSRRADGDISATRSGDPTESVELLEERLRVQAARLASTEARRHAAERGVYLLADGQSPVWAEPHRADLELELAAARRSLLEAAAERDTTRAEIAAAGSTEPAGFARIAAPTEGIVWQTFTSENATVAPGTPVAAWIDCRLLLVDVPVVDDELGLIRAGMAANVVLDGDPEPRSGTVVLKRGSGGPLGADQLAATARDRDGAGQVLVHLEARPGDDGNCPVSGSARVDFPEIDFLDRVRARWRL